MTTRCKLACRASGALKPHWETLAAALKVQGDHTQSGQDIQALALAVKEASLTHLLEKVHHPAGGAVCVERSASRPNQ